MHLICSRWMEEIVHFHSQGFRFQKQPKDSSQLEPVLGNMAAKKPAKGEPALIKECFFNIQETTGGKWVCKKCDGALRWRGSNSGYSAFAQHMTGAHSITWRKNLDDLKSNETRNGNLEGYIRRTVLDKAII